MNLSTLNALNVVLGLAVFVGLALFGVAVLDSWRGFVKNRRGREEFVWSRLDEAEAVTDWLEEAGGYVALLNPMRALRGRRRHYRKSPAHQADRAKVVTDWIEELAVESLLTELDDLCPGCTTNLRAAADIAQVAIPKIGATYFDQNRKWRKLRLLGVVYPEGLAHLARADPKFESPTVVDDIRTLLSHRELCSNCLSRLAAFNPALASAVAFL